MLDDVTGVLFQRITEGVVGGHEEPGIAARFHQRAAGANREGVGIVGPVEAVGLAGVAGQARGRRADDNVDFFHLLRQIVNRERDRGGRELGDHVDAFDLVPAPRDGGGQIGLVLMVRGDHLDFLAKHAAAKILDCQLGGLERPLAAIVGVDAGLIVQNSDFDALRRHWPGEYQAAGRKGSQEQFRSHIYLPNVFF